MSGRIPTPVKIYHIVHVDKLPSIIGDGRLLCDAIIQSRGSVGTTIGMDKIKRRRLEELTLPSYPDLHVGECVPFYFCPRSVMLYMFSRSNHPDLHYAGGQAPIVHLVADMHQAVCWAKQNQLRWAFTSSNAGSNYFDDYTCESDLDKINWDAVTAQQWQGLQEAKQAEFLVEREFPWELIEFVGVFSHAQVRQVNAALAGSSHRPHIEVKRDWYY